MKKILIVLTLFVVCFEMATSQLVRINENVQGVKKSNWIGYVRAGVSLDNYTSLGDIDVRFSKSQRVGFDFDFGFQYGQCFYWGMEVGIGTRGCGIKYIPNNDFPDEINRFDIMSYCLKFIPLTIGYKIALSNKVKIDPHVGGFISADMGLKGTLKTYDGDTQTYHMENILKTKKYDSFDFGLQAGAGIWIDHFNIDITWQKGFIYNYLFITSQGKGATSSNIMFRVGYGF